VSWIARSFLSCVRFHLYELLSFLLKKAITLVSPIYHWLNSAPPTAYLLRSKCNVYWPRSSGSISINAIQIESCEVWKASSALTYKATHTVPMSLNHGSPRQSPMSILLPNLHIWYTGHANLGIVENQLLVVASQFKAILGFFHIPRLKPFRDCLYCWLCCVIPFLVNLEPTKLNLILELFECSPYALVSPEYGLEYHQGWLPHIFLAQS